MKTIARIACVPGMTVAEDIVDKNGKMIVSSGSQLTEAHLAKMARHDIMAVTVHEKIDYATTHYEKIRFSESFEAFEKIYQKNLAIYKTLLLDFVNYHATFNIDHLMDVFDDIYKAAETPELLLDYLYNMIPSEDDLTHSHCLNSALIAGVFGEWLGLSNSDRINYIQTGFVYDIGKLRIPDSILWKPGKLDDSEMALLRRHTTMGYDLVKNLALNVHIPLATLQHHERNDGSGYPDGLMADRIDPYAKLIAIVDTYEAMTSARIYRQSLHPFQVIAHYEETNGFVRYDRDALTTVLSHIAHTQIGRNVRLSDGRNAEVLSINENALSHPNVRLTDNGAEMDLSKFGLSIAAIF
ncbi:MAG: HD domain-containing protein [Lachnospiraceae bacterium]|nr:HD domain-containing protein [Lachnospiraceae bacterium]